MIIGYFYQHDSQIRRQKILYRTYADVRKNVITTAEGIKHRYDTKMILLSDAKI